MIIELEIPADLKDMGKVGRSSGIPLGLKAGINQHRSVESVHLYILCQGIPFKAKIHPMF